MSASVRLLRRPTAILAGAFLALALASTAFAQEADPVAGLGADLDRLWLMLAAFMVFLMQAGFAMVEAGFVRAKNTTNILMKNTLDASIGGIAFFFVGWAFAYGSSDSSNGFIGLGNFALTGFDDYASWIFQFAFAATAATIVSGAMAERTRFSAYLFYSVFISGIIYPVVVHWAWDANGWLTAFVPEGETPIGGGNGYIDFAGSGVVHMVGGFAGLVGAIMVGPRLGKYGPNGEVNAIPGHNIAIATLGMFILWFGWYGFNPGSTLALSGGASELAARVAVTTTLAAAAGGITAVIITKLTTGIYDMGLAVNGILGGLVGITAGCATIDPWASIVVGAVAAAIVIGGVRLLDSFKIDDPVGAVSVHGFAGVWGVLAVGLLSSENGVATAGYLDSSQYGLLLGGGVQQLGIQLLGVAAIVAWTAGTSAVLFGALKVMGQLRVEADEEHRGLDLLEHGIDAYPDFGPSAEGIFAPAGPRGRAAGPTPRPNITTSASASES
ncbi:MAG: ammonium transporter [Dehalococcoidia bacterium]